MIVVPSKSARIKTTNDGIIIREKISESVKKFEEYIRNTTNKITVKGFPLTNNVLIVIQIQYLKNDFISKDVDNIAKTILDSYKGILYVDDKQVTQLFIEKKLSDAYGFLIGIKSIINDKDSIRLPSMILPTPNLKFLDKYEKIQNCNIYLSQHKNK